MEVYRKDGRRSRLYIHVEVQSARRRGFERRMFVYNNRLFDRFGQPVVSLAVLADGDPGWRPASFEVDALGCRHRLEFPVVKLLDKAGDIDALLANPNPFALVAAAHLIGFFRVLDWMMALPRALDNRPWQDIERYEKEQGMAYISSIERIFIEKGHEKGREEGREEEREAFLLDLLAHRFGPPSKDTVARVKAGSADDIRRWGRRVLSAGTLAEVFAAEA